MEQLIDAFGESPLLFGVGATVGVLFGMSAAHSKFCLRAATIEVADGQIGPRLAVWLIAFCSALFLVQYASLADHLDTRNARQIALTGSLSGAILGGLMFGAGMILARGCASRLLVLSASGNLRAIVTGLVLTLTAQASLRGVLSPVRETLANLWTVPGGSERNLLDILGFSESTATAVAAVGLLAAIAFGMHKNVRPSEMIAALGVGFAVFAGWMLTYAIAAASFEIVALQSVTFTGPSADTLMGLVNTPNLPLGFGLGLVPGVVLGAFGVFFIKGEARIQRFEADTPTERYLVGGILMGFGSMLAGGCAVGAGMSGGAILALTAWVAVFAMWLGAMATHRLYTRGAALPASQG